MTLTKQTPLESWDNEQKWTEGKLTLNQGRDMMERGGSREMGGGKRNEKQNIRGYNAVRE